MQHLIEELRFLRRVGELMLGHVGVDKDTAVDLPPLAVATIKQLAAADNDAMVIRFSDVAS